MEGQVVAFIVTALLITTSLGYFFRQLLKSLFKCFGYDQHHNINSEQSEQEDIIIINSVENTNVASSSPPQKYEVFLSFRGEDTRRGFMSHLEKRLRDKKIETFIDNRLNKGDKVSDALIEAIRGSKISVIIFSVNYATSSWCLDEALYIVECMEKQSQVVVPVFYEVDPSHVRNQKGTYDAAFKDLKKRFEEEKVEQWISALTRLANLAGFHSQPYKTESDFIDGIVEDILEKLKDMSSSDDHLKGLVGIDESVKAVKELLQIDSRDVRTIGIWGMGGLGKTTLARAVFKQLSSNFEGCCFLENVREKSEKLEGLEKLKKETFSELLEEKDIEHITAFHEERLRRKQVLIVLDDVDQSKLLDDLTGDQRWFGGGSRVIVTTRYYQVLRNRADKKYELGALSFDCSLELFNLNAFKRNYSLTPDDIKLSKRVVNYAKGIPLALKVIGCLFSSTRRENWEIVLDRLKEVPNKEVQSVLKISYDSLEEQEKRVFLDIVCFVDVVERRCRYYIERIVGGGRSVKLEIDNLIDKSLIFEEQDNLRMHDLVREMGWDIVRHQSEEPGERSRLWNTEDCNNVLKNNTVGTKAIQGIYPSTVAHYPRRPIELNSTAFKGMHNLWLLRIDFSCAYTCGEEHLEYFPSTLKFLEWHRCPFKCMPKSFSLSNLVELRIPDCKLETLIWSEELNNLKHVDLSHSKMLTNVSALSKAPNLESVDLSHCTRLRILPPLTFSHDKNYHKCDYWRCSRLGCLDLSYNTSLEFVSIISGNVRRLNIRWCHKLKQMPSESVINISSLEELDISNCPMLKHLPACVFQLKSLTTLDLGNCKISEIPSEIGCFNLLEKLDLSNNPIVELPKGIKKFSKLKKLLIRDCKSLERLPELPLSLELVNACGCTRLRTISDSRDKLKQEQLSEYHVTRHRTFLYTDCSLLSEDTCRMIVEEFQLRVLRLAAKIHSNSFNAEELGHPDVLICIPRSLFRGYINIREWLTEYSLGSTITVKLPLQWHNATFLGFAICLQFEVLSLSFDIRVSLCKSNLNLRKKNGENRRFEWDFFEREPTKYYYKKIGGLHGSSNMLMLYKYDNYSSCSDAEEVSLNFSDDQEYGKKYRVTACGIRLLYGQEYEEKFEKSNVVNIEEQRVFLDRLKEVPNKIVQNAVKSYDVLDEQEQRVFLDIVCFVDVGERTCRHYVERIVGGGRSVKLEIDSLIEKSLIFEEQGNLRMHDLVREMGREIVRDQSEEPGERSRLWNTEDCNNVLENNTGTKAIQGISQSTSHYSRGPIELSSIVFKEMCNLWFLRINSNSYYANTCSEERLEYCPSTLKFLEWHHCPFKYVPKSFSLSNLVELRFGDCKLETLIWSEELNNLKHVDLSHSKMLTDVSALSKAPNLESVDLSWCSSLRIVPPLRFSDKSYHICDYKRCSRLGYLNLSLNALKVVPIISGNVKTLNISSCKNLKQLPSEWVINISSLEELNIPYCQRLKHLPSEIGCLNLLEKLDLSQNPIGEIPEGIKKLSKLKRLIISNCKSLELLPELPLSLELMNAYGCTGLRKISDSRDKLKHEQLSEYHVPQTGQCIFIYAGCLLLSEDTCRMIVEEFQLRVLRLAAKICLIVEDNFNFEELGLPDVRICIPRYINIREWLTEYSEGPTVTVKLHFQWHNAAFLGFAICVQVEVLANKLKSFSIRDLMCNLDLRKKNGENRRFEWNYIDKKHNYYMDYYTTKGSSNILMWYKYENYSSCSDAEEVSLDFSDAREYGKKYRAIACGIRLLYHQEYEEKFEKSKNHHLRD